MKGRRRLICIATLLVLGIFLMAGRERAWPAPEKKLFVAVGQEPGTLDPSLMNTIADLVVGENYLEYLIYRAPHGDLQPGLATSWKSSPDGNVVEFVLRKGVKFHSGDALTMKDIEFSFERSRLKNPIVKSRLRTMSRLEVVDEYRFRVHFKEPDVTFIPNQGAVAIVSKSYYDRVGEENFVRNPVGTGPYKLVRYVSGEYMDLERFQEYWGEKPSIREARFLFVPEDTTRLSKLKAGEVDMIGSCPYPLVKDVEKTPGLKTIRLSTGHPTPSVVFGTQNPKVPWYDKRVRLAMALAIDRKTIVRDVLQGIPDQFVFLAPYELGYDPQLKPYPYDPKRAKQLLAEAGYPNGFEVNLYWMITGRFPMSREIAEAVASYLEAVGIRAKLVGEEFMAGTSRQRAAKGPEAVYVAFHMHGRAGAPDPSYYLDLFFGKDGTFSTYFNPEVDKLMAQARTMANDAKRADLIKKAVSLIHEDVPSVPIFNFVAVYAMKKNIDFTPTQKSPRDLILVKDITLR
jgi:peptide/nickel transport system substrate-binding protein